ncbi:hypothetical protein LOTGIDRAFT_238746 [Lottia gigantea]|uniref:Sugar phosphate transporter domain-containing protein n=1 Tax=Lottia gigantea TaxID=225164 RepID=V4AX79_LOTGI|nr:hypothetical protein LOTGIDRAFT_238746 [Lottia gigantea]ESO99660.1 hypothetical protein LOTGIDRAFT_238746 [Lottia gigantea]
MTTNEIKTFSMRNIITVFGLWTGTSFLCHYSGKLFLMSEAENESTYNFIKAFFLTLYQTFMCYSLTEVKFHSDKVYICISVCHGLATLSTNCSVALMFASSTFAIKLMEPITSACVQRLLLATPLHPSIFVSLPLIVGGACMFTGNPPHLYRKAVSWLFCPTSSWQSETRQSKKKIKIRPG